MRYIRDVEDSKALNFQNTIRQSSSAPRHVRVGRILHHLKNNIEDSDNTILFSGFQLSTPWTPHLGRRPAGAHLRYIRRPRLRRSDQRLQRARADSQELLEWVRPINRERLQKVFLVHGELDSATALQRADLPPGRAQH
ncbi:MAG: MBL fold metallo-hydrolase RNA specificity domain-containing protein [Caldilineales bacterium]